MLSLCLKGLHLSINTANGGTCGSRTKTKGTSQNVEPFLQLVCVRSHPARQQMSDRDSVCQSPVTVSVHPQRPPWPPQGRTSFTGTWTWVSLTLHIVAPTHCVSILSRHGGDAVDGRSPTTLVLISLGQFVMLMNMELHFLDMFNDSPTPTRLCWSLCLPPAPHSSIVKVVSMHGAHFHNYISPARPNKGLNSSSCWI